jgi:hypothetical protein
MRRNPDRTRRLVSVTRTPGHPRLTLRGVAGLLVIVPWLIGIWTIAVWVWDLFG